MLESKPEGGGIGYPSRSQENLIRTGGQPRGKLKRGGTKILVYAGDDVLASSMYPLLPSIFLRVSFKKDASGRRMDPQHEFYQSDSLLFTTKKSYLASISRG